MRYFATLSLRQKLRWAFGSFAALLLLLLWLGSLIYFFHNERNELLATLRTQAAMLATQSSAAVMFGDRQVLTENLASLRHLPNIRWALALTTTPPATSPTSPTSPTPSTPSSQSAPPADTAILATYRTPPPDIDATLARLEREGGETIDNDNDNLIISHAIEYGGILRGRIVLAVDLHRDKLLFAIIVIISLLVELALFVLVLGLFRRFVDRTTQPLRELARIADQTSHDGIPTTRAAASGSDEIGQLALAFNRMLDTLALRQEELAHSRDDLRALGLRLQEIREEERTRIAHEIHDELGQRLTALKFAVSRLPESAARHDIAGQTDAAIKTVRTISWELRPALLDSLGLYAALEWLASDFQRRIGMRCGLDLPEGEPALDPAQATDLFRLCQELLTNIARHANASRADIEISEISDIADIGEHRRTSGLLIEVRDNGIGMPADAARKRSLGLLGLRERSARWHGKLTIASRPDFPGTRIRITLPIHPPPPATTLTPAVNSPS